MSNPVLVVTDSTCDLPPTMATSLGIVVVPLTVMFGENAFLDGVELGPEEFLRMLKSSNVLPKTSQPSIAAFQTVFQEALDRGQDVVCITISSNLSGTFNSARLAAEELESDRIAVVDSRSASVQLGLVAVAAARKAAEAASRSEVQAEAKIAIERVHLYAVLQTLEYAQKGGRIGRAQALVGTALAIKPVLSVVDGVVTPIERVRTWNRAVNRATDLAIALDNVTDIIVLHSDNLPDATRVADTLRTAFPEATTTLTFAGATIATYAGPGAVGLAALTAR